MFAEDFGGRIHTLPNRDHLSGHPDARHVRRLHREPFATRTTAAREKQARIILGSP